MARQLNGASISKTEEGRYRVAVDYTEDGQATGGDVETVDTFDEAVQLLQDREANPSPAPTAPNQTSISSPESAGQAPADQPHSADPNAQDSPAAQPGATSLSQETLSQSNPADLQTENTAASDALAADNEHRQAEQDAGTAN